MTSGELLNKRFEKAHVGGYRTTEVESFLAEAATAFSALTHENEDLKRQLDAYKNDANQVEDERDSLRDTLISAQKFADSLTKDAKKKADDLVVNAQAEADRLVNEARTQALREKEEFFRIKREVTEFRSKLLVMYRAHLEQVGAIPVEKIEESAKPDQKAQEEAAAAIETLLPPPSPVVPESSPVVPKPSPVVPESSSVVPKPSPVIPESSSVTSESSPVVPDSSPVVLEKASPIPPAQPVVPTTATPSVSTPSVKTEQPIKMSPPPKEETADKEKVVVKEEKKPTPTVPKRKRPIADFSHTATIRLNMRYDEKTGEYLPFSVEDDNH